MDLVGRVDRVDLVDNVDMVDKVSMVDRLAIVNIQYTVGYFKLLLDNLVWTRWTWKT